MTKTILPKPKHSLYDEDFVLWLEAQVRFLREGHFDVLDIDNLIEEVEAIARQDKREVRSRLTLLLTHLLKHQFQPEKRGTSWLNTIRTQRRELDLVFEDSPSLLKTYAPAIFPDLYTKARQNAHDETGLPLETFPESCPYTLEQTLDPYFLS